MNSIHAFNVVKRNTTFKRTWLRYCNMTSFIFKNAKKAVFPDSKSNYIFAMTIEVQSLILGNVI